MIVGLMMGLMMMDLMMMDLIQRHMKRHIHQMMKMILRILKKKYDNLLLKHFQLRKNMKETKDELDKTKDK